MAQAAIPHRVSAARATTSAGTWPAAAAAVGTLAAVLVLACQTRPVVEAAAWSWHFAEQAPTIVVGPIGVARLAGWALLVAALVAGWHAAAALGAGAAALAELAVLVTGVRDHAAPGWHLLLAVVVAVPLGGSLLLTDDGGREQRPLPGRFWAAAAAMGLCASLSAAGAPLVADRFGDTVAISTIPVARTGFGTLALVALFSLVAVLALPVAVRRRALANCRLCCSVDGRRAAATSMSNTRKLANMSSLQRGPEVLPGGVAEEGDHVEEVGLTGAVGSDEYVERGEPHLHRPKAAKVAHRRYGGCRTATAAGYPLGAAPPARRSKLPA